MSILELQRRLVEVGRIRMGEKKTTQSGGTRPAKLTRWRLTSKDEVRLQAAARIYGGTVQTWDDQYELYTDSDALDIAIIPGQALSQFYELWGRPAPKKPVVCLRRCDGATELLTDKPCPCLAELAGAPDKDRQCKPTSRLLVLLRTVPGIGAWRLDTHGWYAAQELAGTAEMLEMLTASRVPVRARLRLEQRNVQRGEELRRFVVPVIDIDATLDDAMAALTGGQRPAIDAAHPDPMVELHVEHARAAIEAETAKFRPVPKDLAAPPSPSIAEQLATAHKPPPRAPRANAATPIPPTRLPHRDAPAPELPPEHGESVGDDEPHTSPPADTPPPTATPAAGGPAADPESAPTSHPPVDVGEVPGSAATAPAAPVVTAEEAASIARMCREAGVPRAAFLAAWSHEQQLDPITSARAVPADQMPPLRARLLDIFYGRTILIVDGEHDAVRLVEVGTNQPGENVTLPPDAYWKARLEHVRGVGPARLLRMARKIAQTLALPVPSTIAEIPADPELRRQLNVWLLEHLDDAAA